MPGGQYVHIVGLKICVSLETMGRILVMVL